VLALLLVGLLLLAGPSSVTSSTSAQSSDPGKPFWPMSKADAGGTGHAASRAAANAGTTLWLRYFNTTFVPEQLTTAQGPLLIGSDGSICLFFTDNYAFPSNPALCGVMKFDANGKELWQAPGYLSEFVGAIASDGTIIFPGHDALGTPKLFALDPDGNLKWSRGILDGPHSRLVIGPEDESCLLTSNRTEGLVLQIIQRDGGYYRNVTLPNEPYYSYADHISNLLVAPNGTAYAVTLNNITSVGPNGIVRPIFRTEYDFWNHTDPSLAMMLRPDGTLIVKNKSYLWAIQPNGSLLWSLGLAPYYAMSPPSLAPDGTILLLTAKSTNASGWLDMTALLAITSAGQIEWITTFDMPQATQYIEMAPIISSDGITFLGIGETIIAVNPDGSLRYQKDIGGFLDGQDSMVIGEKGVLFALARNHSATLTAIGPMTSNSGSLDTLALILPPLLILGAAAVALYAIRTRKR